MNVDGLKETHPTDMQEENNEENRSRLSSSTALFHALASTLIRDQRSPAIPWHTRKLCGRWLLVHRLRCGIAVETIADQSGLDAETLTLLELGLTDAQNGEDARWDSLALLLANAQADADLVRTVIHTALGVASYVSDTVIQRVYADLTPPSPRT